MCLSCGSWCEMKSVQCQMEVHASKSAYCYMKPAASLVSGSPRGHRVVFLNFVECGLPGGGGECSAVRDFMIWQWRKVEVVQLCNLCQRHHHFWQSHAVKYWGSSAGNTGSVHFNSYTIINTLCRRSLVRVAICDVCRWHSRFCTEPVVAWKKCKCKTVSVIFVALQV